MSGWKRRIEITAAACLLCASLCLVNVAAASGQTLARRNWAGSGITVDPWWFGAEMYSIDPIDFQDSDGDGYGDLAGIVSRLDYLQGLGVEALVLSPFTAADTPAASAATLPFDLRYGSSEEFERLLTEASRRKMRVLVDLPLTRTRTAEQTGNMARFWMSRGVAGLQLTSDQTSGDLSVTEREERVRELRHICAGFAGQRVLLDPLAPPLAGVPAATSRRVHARHGSRRRTRQGSSFSQSPTPASATSSTEVERERFLSLAGGFSASSLRQALLAATPHSESSSGAEVLRTDGDDRPRSYTRWGDGLHDEALAKIAATYLLTAEGAPLLLFGQEVGMASSPAAERRPAAPTPMQWGGDPGFTSGVPWIDPGPNAGTANVTAEDTQAGSLLNWYRTLGTLRLGNPALHGGRMEVLLPANPAVVAWVRRPRVGGALRPPVLVVVNASAQPIAFSLTSELSRVGLHAGSLRRLAATFPGEPFLDSGSIALPPHGVFIGEVGRAAGLENVVLPPRRRYR